MPSQEDYLDSLLKNMMNEAQPETEKEEISSDDRFQEDALSGEELLTEMMEEEPLPENILPSSFEEMSGADWNVEEFDEAAAELAGFSEEEEKIPTEEAAVGMEAFDESGAKTEDLEEEAEKADISSGWDGAPDLDAVSAMSEDEIERLLASSGEEAEAEDSLSQPDDSGDFPDDDLLGMLKDTDDGDLMDIQTMLEKADNNEAVDDEIVAMLNGADAGEPLEGEQASGSEDEKSRQADEKKRLRREKAAAKKAARAAAKEEKAAARAAAKAAKEAARAEKAAAPKAAVKEAKAAAGAIAGTGIGEEEAKAPGLTAGETIQDDEDGLFDPDILDSIVSEAELADREETSAQPGADLADLADEPLGELPDSFDGTAAQALDGMEIPEADTAGADSDDTGDMGFDINSLFGDVDESGLGSGEGGDSAFPDFVDIDGDNVENLLPELKETGRKKKGLLSRLFEMLTEEDEEEENEDIRLSNENRDILNDLDNEKKAGKKKKKKVKKVNAQEDEDGEDGKGKGKGKAKKPKKEKKPKPEKPKKEPEAKPLIPEKKLSPKKVIPIFVVCASLGVLIVVFANASVDFGDKKTAKEAYYAQDYQTCYQNLFGKDLNETEQIMFGTSKSILYIRLWLSEYEMFAEAGEEVEALDSLIQTVNNYPALYDYAVSWNAGDEVAAGYASILNILSEKYGLTEAQAKEIAAVRSNYKYTQMVVAIVQGKPFGSWDASASVLDEPQQAPDAMEDELPEESELTDGSFIDGGTN